MSRLQLILLAPAVSVEEVASKKFRQKILWLQAQVGLQRKKLQVVN